MFHNLKSDWSLVPVPFVFDNFVHEKGLGSKEKMKLTILRLFDSPVSKDLIFERISCIQWVFWVIYQISKVLAFRVLFLHDFSIKIFLI